MDVATDGYNDTRAVKAIDATRGHEVTDELGVDRVQCDCTSLDENLTRLKCRNFCRVRNLKVARWAGNDGLLALRYGRHFQSSVV